MIKAVVSSVFVIAAGMALGWLLLEEPQRNWVRVQLGQAPVADRSQPLPLPGSEPADSRQSPTPTIPPQSVTRFSELLVQRFNCIKPVTNDITDEPQSQIYSWVDAEGRRHFSDQAPASANARDLSDRYAGGAAVLDLTVESPDGLIQAGLRDRLETDVRAIYRYLGDELGITHLRRISLNLKVYTDASGYQEYQRAQAPGLEGSAGFYSAVNNEAVVLQQRAPAHTLSIARHESTHVMVAGLYGQTPIWFNEGLAEFFSDYQSKAMSRSLVLAPWRLAHLERLLEQNRMPRLGYFLHLSSPQWRTEAPETMYAMAWSVVAYLMDQEDGRRTLAAIMNHLAENPCSPERTESWIERYHPGGWEAFVSGWERWLQRKIKTNG